jgi:hypothetical protein
MIGKWMETLGDRYLQRLADAPASEWCCNGFHTGVPGAGCLMTNAFGYKNAFIDNPYGYGMTEEFAAFTNLHRDVWNRFDDLHNRGGQKYKLSNKPANRDIVRMIQNRARRILATRALSAMPEVRRAAAQPATGQ